MATFFKQIIYFCKESKLIVNIRNFQNFQFWIIHSYEYLRFRGQKYQEIGVAEPTWAHGKSLKPLHSEKRDAFWYRILSPCIVC